MTQRTDADNNFQQTEIKYLSIDLAIDLLLAVWAVFLLLKLYYGNYQINKLTFQPFVWAFLFIAANLMYQIAYYFGVREAQSFQEFQNLPFYIRVIVPLAFLYSYFIFMFIITIFNEIEVLSIYIIFQRSVDPNQLDQKRTQYNRIEQFIQKSWTHSAYFFAACCLLSIVAMNIKSVDRLLAFVYIFFPIIIFQAGTLICITMLGLTFLVAMRRYQHYEFEKHWRRVVFQIVIFGACALTYLLINILIAIEIFGIAQNQSFNLTTDYRIISSSSNEAVIGAAFRINFSFTPFLPLVLHFLYLTFWEPHDCFACFNRLPNKRYSIYQYTIDERARQRDRHYGKGAIDRFEELLEGEKQQNERELTIVEGSEEIKNEYNSYKMKMNQLLIKQSSIQAHSETAKAFDQREIPVTERDIAIIMQDEVPKDSTIVYEENNESSLIKSIEPQLNLAYISAKPNEP